MQDLVTVFGGSGFVGSQVVRALAKRGFRVRVAVRQPHLAHKMRLLGDVGQVQVVQANVRDAASVARALEGAQACVNLVGVLYEAGPNTFQAVHVEAAGLVAHAAKAAGATRFVHMSALGADAGSSSNYARTKAEGEAAVRAAFPGAIVLRPSVMFGPGDDFLNKFAQMAAMSPVLPLVGGGENRLQPVFVTDVARALVNALADPAAAGQTYELGGAGVFSMREVMELILDVTGRKRMLLPMPYGVAAMIGAVSEILTLTPVPPPITRDQVELLKTDNVVGGQYAGLADLGVSTPETMEAISPSYLYRFRRGGQYADEVERLVGA
jgi:NADH dehydrogenase